jgi:hypothetical protein
VTHPFRNLFFHRDHHLTHCTHAPYRQVLPMSYSSFFSSGLSAIQNLTPPPSPTQLVRPDSPIVPLTPTRETTDATNQEPTPTAANPSQGFSAERPKLRRRRSSLTVNTSPLVQLKGSYRGAAAAVQRQNRSRSGSVNDFSQPRSIGFASEENNPIGRLRSGSVGNSLRCVPPYLATTWHTKVHMQITSDRSRGQATSLHTSATLAHGPFHCPAPWRLRVGSRYRTPSSPYVKDSDRGKFRANDSELARASSRAGNRIPIQTGGEFPRRLCYERELTTTFYECVLHLRFGGVKSDSSAPGFLISHYTSC